MHQLKCYDIANKSQCITLDADTQKIREKYFKCKYKANEFKTYLLMEL